MPGYDELEQQRSEYRDIFDLRAKEYAEEQRARTEEAHESYQTGQKWRENVAAMGGEDEAAGYKAARSNYEMRLEQIGVDPQEADEFGRQVMDGWKVAQANPNWQGDFKKYSQELKTNLARADQDKWLATWGAYEEHMAGREQVTEEHQFDNVPGILRGATSVLAGTQAAADSAFGAGNVEAAQSFIAEAAERTGLQGAIRGAFDITQPGMERGEVSDSLKGASGLVAGRNVINEETYGGLAKDAWEATGHLAGALSGMAGVGKLGQTLRYAKGANALTRAIGWGLGGHRAAKGAGLLGRAAASMIPTANNIGSHAFMTQASGALTGGLAESQRTGRPFWDAVSDRMEGIAGNTASSYITGLMIPWAQAGGKYLGGAFAGQTAGGKLWGELVKGDTRAKTQWIMAKMAEGFGEASLFTALPQMHGDPEGQMFRNLRDLFSDDTKVRNKAITHLAVNTFAFGYMKMRNGEAPRWMGAESKAALKDFQTRREARLREGRELTPSEEMGISPEMMQKIMEKLTEAGVEVDIPEGDAVAMQKAVLEAIRVADQANLLRGDTRGSIMDRVLAEVQPTDKYAQKVAESEARLARLQEKIENAARVGDIAELESYKEQYEAAQKSHRKIQNENPALRENLGKEKDAAQADLELADAMEREFADLLQAAANGDHDAWAAIEQLKRRDAMGAKIYEVMGLGDISRENVTYDLSEAVRSAQEYIEGFREQSRQRIQAAEAELRNIDQAERERLGVDVPDVLKGGEAEGPVVDTKAEARQAKAADAERAGVVKAQAGQATSANDVAAALRAQAKERYREGEQKRGDAYEKAAALVDSRPQEVMARAKQGKKSLMEMPGIGKKTAAVILESLGLNNQGKPLAAPKPRPSETAPKASEPAAAQSAKDKEKAAPRKVGAARAPKEPETTERRGEGQREAPRGRRRADYEDQPGDSAEVRKLKALAREDFEAAYTDELTGAGSRRAAIASRRNAKGVGVFDIVGLKKANEGPQGQTGGDNMILERFDALREAAAKVGVPERNIFRTGGDEFEVHAPQAKLRAMGKMLKATDWYTSVAKTATDQILPDGTVKQGAQEKLAGVKERAKKKAAKAAKAAKRAPLKRKKAKIQEPPAPEYVGPREAVRQVQIDRARQAAREGRPEDMPEGFDGSVHAIHARYRNGRRPLTRQHQWITEASLRAASELGTELQNITRVDPVPRDAVADRSAREPGGGKKPPRPRPSGREMNFLKQLRRNTVDPNKVDSLEALDSLAGDVIKVENAHQAALEAVDRNPSATNKAHADRVGLILAEQRQRYRDARKRLNSLRVDGLDEKVGQGTVRIEGDEAGSPLNVARGHANDSRLLLKSLRDQRVAAGKTMEQVRKQAAGDGADAEWANNYLDRWERARRINDDAERLFKVLENIDRVGKKVATHDADFRGGGSMPAPVVGDILRVKTPGGQREVVVLAVPQARLLRPGEAPGKRFTVLDLHSGERTRIRLNDVRDIGPTDIGNMQMHRLTDVQQIAELANDNPYGVELTARTVEGMMARFTESAQHTVRSAPGTGGQDVSMERSERIATRTDLDKPWLVKQYKGKRAEQYKPKGWREGDPLAERMVDDWSGDPVPTKDVMAAVEQEARARTHRRAHGAMTATDHAIEAQGILERAPREKISRGALTTDEITDFEARKGRASVKARKALEAEGINRDPTLEEMGMQDAELASLVYVMEQGKARVYDPRKVEYDWFNATEREAAEARFKETATKSEWEQYVRERAAYEAAAAELDHTFNPDSINRKRNRAFLPIYPTKVADMKVGDSVLMSLRTLSTSGRAVDRALYSMQLTPEGTFVMQRVKGKMGLKHWLEEANLPLDTNVDKLTSDALARERAHNVERISYETIEKIVTENGENMEGLRKAKVISDRARTTVEMIEQAVEMGDFRELEAANYDRIPELAEFSSKVQDLPIAERRAATRDFLARGSGKTGRLAADAESTTRVPIGVEIMARAREGLDPVTGANVHTNKAKNLVVTNGPSKGVVLGSNFGMDGRQAMQIWRAGAGIVRGAFDVHDGIIEGSVEGIEQLFFRPMRATVGWAIDTLSGEGYQGGARARRWFGGDDPTGARRAALNELDGHRKHAQETADRLTQEVLDAFGSNQELVDAIGRYHDGAEVHPALKKYQRLMNRLGRQLVEEGVLTEEQYQTYKDKYVHLGRWKAEAVDVEAKTQEVKDAMAAVRAEMKVLKSQGKDVKEHQDHLRLLSQSLSTLDGIKGRRLKNQVFSEPISAMNIFNVRTLRNAGFTRRRTVGSWEEALKAGLDTESAGQLLYESIRHEMAAVAEARFFRRMSADPEFSLPTERAPKNWVRIDEARLPDDPVWRNFAGMSVEPQMYDWLTMSEPTQAHGKSAIEAITSALKMSRTTFNPRNWLQQLFGNPAIMAGAGVPTLKTVPEMFNGFAAIMGKGKYGHKRAIYLKKKGWLDVETDADREFMKYLEANFTHDQIHGMSAAKLIQRAVTGFGHEQVRGAKARGEDVSIAAQKIARKMVQIYRHLDAGARIGTYESLMRDRGMTDAEATKVVNELFDIKHLGKVPSALRKATLEMSVPGGRRVAIPNPLSQSFISFPTMMARAPKAALSGSLKAATPAWAIIQGINWVYAQMTGQTMEEVNDRLDAMHAGQNGVVDTVKRLFAIAPLGGRSYWEDMPLEGALGAVPGVKQAAYSLIDGQGITGHDDWGMDVLEGIGSKIGHGNVAISPAYSYLTDRWSSGRGGVRDYYDRNKGLLGSKGLARMLLEEYAPVALAFGASKLPGLSKIPGSGATRAGAAAAGGRILGNLRKVAEDKRPDILHRDLELGEMPGMIRAREGIRLKPKEHTAWEYAMAALGFRPQNVDAFREIINRAEREGLAEEGRFGLQMRDDLRTQAGEEAQRAHGLVAEAKSVFSLKAALHVHGLLQQWKTATTAEQEEIKEVILERYTLDQIKKYLRVLGQFEEGAAYEMAELWEASGILEEQAQRVRPKAPLRR